MDIYDPEGIPTIPAQRTVTEAPAVTVTVQQARTERLEAIIAGLEADKRELLLMLKAVRLSAVLYRHAYIAMCNDAPTVWPDVLNATQLTDEASALIRKHTPPPTVPALSLSAHGDDPTQTPQERVQDEH